MVIPYGRQSITDDDISAVIEALKADYLTQGPQVVAFEKLFAKYIGSKYAVAVSNGTAALHLCALALDVKAEGKVITTPITFAASANCIRYCGGEVEFCDIDPQTYLLDLEKLKLLLKTAPKGTYRGIIPVDFAGRAINMEAYREIANKYDLWIIEDACHAPGGYFTDSKDIRQSCGNGQYADLAIFSFHPVKHIATGEGGMITTNDVSLYEKLLQLRTHGITRNPLDFKNSIAFAEGVDNTESNQYPGWYMEMQELGFNYRLSDFQCALGMSQLNRAGDGLERRREIARKYHNAFEGEPYIINQSGVVEGHAYHLYIIQVQRRLELYNYLRSKDILAQIHYIPCHLMPYYRELGWEEGDCPAAENYYRNCISLPMYPTLKGAEQDFIIALIKEFYTLI